MYHIRPVSGLLGGEIKLNFKCFAKVFLVLCLFCIGFSLYAQTAQVIENILSKDELTYAEAAGFILRASEKLVTSDEEEAFWFAAKKYWLPKNVSPDDPAKIDGIAFLLLNAFDIEGGVMYSITKSPHYAFRELQYRNIIQGRADRYMKVSGAELVFITGRVLEESEKEADLAAKFAEERETMGSKGHLQPLSYDFGLILTQDNAFYHDYNYGDTEFDYTASAVPRFSFLLGDKGLFLTSMGFTFEYDSTERDISSIFELLRTEFSIRFGRFGLRGGRFNYTDPMSYVAYGLFDGLQLTHTSSAGQFGLGVWYTGALYKKNANILMTQNDWDIFEAPMEKGYVLRNYFAPPRLMASIDWEHPSIGEAFRFSTALTGQMDISKQEQKYHSQYLTLSAGLNLNNFLITGGGSLELAEVADDEATTLQLAVAGELGFSFPLPTKLDSRLSLKARYATGNSNPFLSQFFGRLSSRRRNNDGSKAETFSPFIPLTTLYQNEIFKMGMAGHTVIDLAYSVRFLRTLGGSLTASYFIRNDLVTPNIYIITGKEKEKKFLGMELFSKIVWSPLTDLQYNLGIGTFVPVFGNNWPNARTIWKIDLTTLIALY